jgi:hypothetical protein
MFYVNCRAEETRPPITRDVEKATNNLAVLSPDNIKTFHRRNKERGGFVGNEL